MRLNSSIQPTSTRRSPRRGSRPVVSVSRTISRIRSRQLQHDLEKCEAVFRKDHAQSKISRGESGPPPRHLNSLVENVADPRAHGIETVRGIHDEVGAPALFFIRYLPSQDGVEFFIVHRAPRQYALALK